jgi:putative FmdB family regulatory protein
MIADYKCLTCDHVFEFMKIRSNERVTCEKCGEQKQEQLIQQVSKGTSFQLKGTGWYKDKYRGK